MKLLDTETGSLVRYFTTENFTNNFPITFEVPVDAVLQVQVGFSIKQEGTDYAVVLSNGIYNVVFKEALKIGLDVTLRRVTKSLGVPHVFSFTGNAQGQSEFNAKTIDENFEHAYRVVGEISDYNTATADMLEHAFGDASDLVGIANEAKDTANEAKDLASGLDGRISDLEDAGFATESYVNSEISKIPKVADLPYTTTEMYREVGDSDYEVLLKAFNSGVSHLIISPIEYNLHTDLKISNFKIGLVTGKGTINLHNCNLVIENSIQPLNVDVLNKYSGASELNIQRDVNVGDVLVVRNPDPYSLSKARDYYHDGYMAKVYKSESGIAYLMGVTPKINESAIEISLLPSQEVEFRDFTVNCLNNSTMILSYFTGVTLHSIYSNSLESTVALKVDKCFNVKWYGGYSISGNGIAYPLQISNCQHVRVDSYLGSSSRHAIALGGDGRRGSVPYRDVSILNSTLLNTPEFAVNNSPQPVADVHGNGIDVKYINCTLLYGGILAGRNVTFKDCTIYSHSKSSGGVVLAGTELIGGLFCVEGCNIHVNVLGTKVGRGAGIIANHLKYRDEDTYLDFKDCNVIFETIGEDFNGNMPIVTLMDEFPSGKVHLKVQDVRLINAPICNEMFYLDTKGTTEYRFNIEGVLHDSFKDTIGGSQSSADFRINYLGISRGTCNNRVSSSGSQTNLITITLPYYLGNRAVATVNHRLPVGALQGNLVPISRVSGNFSNKTSQLNVKYVSVTGSQLPEGTEIVGSYVIDILQF